MPHIVPRPTHEDMFLFDREELQKIARESTVSRGLICFNENRVLELDHEEDRLWAQVEDDDVKNFPLAVQVEKDDNDRLILSKKVPVALIDHFALEGLSRLGASSPVAEAETYFVPDDLPPEEGPSKLAALAAEKLEGARVLMTQSMVGPALELLVSALLAKACDLAGLDTATTPSEAGVWIYGDAMPKGIISGDEAGLIMRAIGLSQADNVPQDLMVDLMADATVFAGEE